MIEPKKYKVNPTITEKKLLYNKFISNLDYYSYKKSIYGNYIFLNLHIDKSDFYLTVNVQDNNGFTFSPFYNPNDRHNNLVYKEVVKNYNNFMDSLVSKKILVDDSGEHIMNNVKTIRIKYFGKNVKKLEKFTKGDWIDLSSTEDITMKAGEFKLIRLGIAMELPKGYEAHIVSRSSTFKNYGIIQANSIGIIDNTYCGDKDEWMFPAYALRDTTVRKNDRICQFRIVENQPPIHFEEVDVLGNKDRGGIGSTGKN